MSASSPQPSFGGYTFIGTCGNPQSVHYGKSGSQAATDILLSPDWDLKRLLNWVTDHSHGVVLGGLDGEDPRHVAPADATHPSIPMSTMPNSGRELFDQWLKGTHPEPQQSSPSHRTLVLKAPPGTKNQQIGYQILEDYLEYIFKARDDLNTFRAQGDNRKIGNWTGVERAKQQKVEKLIRQIRLVVVAFNSVSGGVILPPGLETVGKLGAPFPANQVGQGVVSSRIGPHSAKRIATLLIQKSATVSDSLHIVDEVEILISTGKLHPLVFSRNSAQIDGRRFGTPMDIANKCAVEGRMRGTGPGWTRLHVLD